MCGDPTILEGVSGLLVFIAIVVCALLIGTAARALSLRSATPEVRSQRWESLRVWWILLGALTAAILAGKIGLAILMYGAGLLALREFNQLYLRHAPDASRLAWAVGLLGLGHYAWLVLVQTQWSLLAFPLFVWLACSTVQVVHGERHGYLRATGGYCWAAVLLFWGLSHVVVLSSLPASSDLLEKSSLAAGPMGWPLFVILLTQCDDIAQALIGRRIGRHKMPPAISPGKTWEGFVGGLVVSVLLSVVAAPWLTSLMVGYPSWRGFAIAIGAGVIVSVVGFIGDVNMSALKREAGVKDSGNLLPGMGGMIDRIDSLTFTAPALYYYALLFNLTPGTV